MFARSVTMRLKPNSVSDFNKTLEKEILPLLQKQKGFRDELALVSSNGSEVVGISLWNERQDAEAYNRAAYPDVQRILSKVIEGTPQVQNLRSVPVYDPQDGRAHGIASACPSGGQSPPILVASPAPPGPRPPK